MNDKCPKCQAETSYRHGAYKCGSLVHYDGQFVQSDKCRIIELQTENAALKADKEVLVANLDALLGDFKRTPMPYSVFAKKCQELIDARKEGV